ncbi:MAG: adenosylcobinamide-GDP ribazoletransferase [Thermoflexales bacterium]|nr:adenosylcobinamide-GDP ribazoletransferase [Thermoflexales bacterium]MDW8352238.1 adenosylcobinamide-GDP ribazoletransferase [Anaerolineae bacterium]
MLNGFLEAIRFLTLIPLPFMPPMTRENYEETIARAMAWFPAVGALIGLLACAAGWAAGALWGDFARAVAVVIAIAVITAGLHLDGLSDTFDAVMSWRPRERKLEIMKDSRIGAMGALALVAVILLKLAFLTAAGADWVRAVPVAAALGRWADLYGIFFFPAAREGGLGRSFRDFIRRGDFVFATLQMLVIVAVACVLGRPPQVWPMALLRGAMTIALVLLAAHLIFARWTKALGGLTGDTYGAMCEIGEVIALAAMSARPF